MTTPKTTNTDPSSAYPDPIVAADNTAVGYGFLASEDSVKKSIHDPEIVGIMTAVDLSRYFRAIDDYVLTGNRYPFQVADRHSDPIGPGFKKFCADRGMSIPSTIGNIARDLHHLDNPESLVRCSETLLFLGRVHESLLDLRGLSRGDFTWQTRKPLTKNSLQRQQLIQSQHIMARECLAEAGISIDRSLSPAVKHFLPNSMTDEQLKLLLIRASINALIKPSLNEILTSGRFQLEELFKNLRDKTIRYEKVNRFKREPSRSIYEDAQRLANKPKKRLGSKRLWTATNTVAKYLSFNKHPARASEAKDGSKGLANTGNAAYRSLVDPKASELSSDPNTVVNTGRGLESLGLSASFLSLAEAMSGSMETYNKIRFQRNQKYLNAFTRRKYEQELALMARLPGAEYDLARAYAQMKVGASNKSKNEIKSAATRFDIIGNSVRYPTNIVRVGLNVPGYISKVAQGTTAATPALIAASIGADSLLGPVATLALGLSVSQLHRTHQGLKADRVQQKGITQAMASLTDSEHSRIFGQLLHNRHTNTTRSLYQKTWRSVSNCVQYTTTSVAGLWTLAGVASASIAAPPVALVAAASAVSAGAGALGLGLLLQNVKDKRRPAARINSANELSAAINNNDRDQAQVERIFKKNTRYIKKLLKHNGMSKYELDRRRVSGWLKRKNVFEATPKNIEMMQLVLQQQATKDYMSTYNASENLFKLVDLIRYHDDKPEVRTFLEHAGLSRGLIDTIRQAPLSADNVKKFIDILASTLKVVEYTPVKQYTEYVSQHTDNTDSVPDDQSVIFDAFARGSVKGDSPSISDNDSLSTISAQGKQKDKPITIPDKSQRKVHFTLTPPWDAYPTPKTKGMPEATFKSYTSRLTPPPPKEWLLNPMTHSKNQAKGQVATATASVRPPPLSDTPKMSGRPPLAPTRIKRMPTDAVEPGKTPHRSRKGSGGRG